MTSSFMGLYVQRNALMLSQKALDITGNNISNINTKGYTRQRLDICSVGIHRGVLGYGNAIDYSGRGADAIGVAQLRDRILDREVRTYNGKLCDTGVKVTTLSDIEDIFDSIEADSSENEASFAAIVNKFKAALQSYTTDHADRSEMASIVRNTAESLTQALRKYDLELDKVAESVLEDTKKTVDRINTILSEMGSLNKHIKDAYVTMGYITSTNGNYQVQHDYGPLELKDKMNLLLDELSQYGNIEFKEESDGTFTVKFADQLVVSEKYYAQMAITEVNPRTTEMSFIITTGEVDENGKPINGGLYDNDTWYKMNTDNATGGDSSILVRDLLKGNTVNITGQDVRGNNYLNSGALRGYLDMYNGRDLFVKNKDGSLPYNSIEQQLEIANKAIDRLATDGLSRDEINEIIETLKESVNAKVKETDGKFEVTVNGVTILNTADGTKKTLSVVNPDTPYRGNAQIVADDGSAAAKAREMADAANEALRKLEAGEALTDDDKAALSAIGARLTERTEDDGSGGSTVVRTVTANGVTLFDSSVPDSRKIVRAADELDENGKAVISADGRTISSVAGEEVRTIAINSYTGIEYYRDMLNSFVKTLADSFNNVYREENPDFDPDLPEGPDNPRYLPMKNPNFDPSLDVSEDNPMYIELFSYGDDFRNATKHLRLTELWIHNPEILANPTGSNDFEELDNTYLHKLLALFTNDLEYNDGMGHRIAVDFPLDKFVTHINEDVGSKVSAETSSYDTTDIHLTSAEIGRSEVMDVSMNEEGINMMNYQKWYNAISRMISTLDEALDKLINQTGLVGLR